MSRTFIHADRSRPPLHTYAFIWRLSSSLYYYYPIKYFTPSQSLASFNLPFLDSKHPSLCSPTGWQSFFPTMTANLANSWSISFFLYGCTMDGVKGHVDGWTWLFLEEIVLLGPNRKWCMALFLLFVTSVHCIIYLYFQLIIQVLLICISATLECETQLFSLLVIHGVCLWRIKYTAIK